MNLRALLAAAAALVFPLGALAAEPFTSLHPEEAHPDPKGEVSPDLSADFIRQLQRRLHEHGFDAGPVNGAFGEKTQAALVQFQLSRPIPASGQLDDATMAALGLERQAPQADASAGATELLPASPEKKDQ